MATARIKWRPLTEFSASSNAGKSLFLKLFYALARAGTTRMRYSSAAIHDLLVHCFGDDCQRGLNWNGSKSASLAIDMPHPARDSTQRSKYEIGRHALHRKTTPEPLASPLACGNLKQLLYLPTKRIGW